MKVSFMSRYPSIEDLRAKAGKRIPKFAFEYLDGGCNEEINLAKNTRKIREIELTPFYLNRIGPPSMKTSLFGEQYDAPMGIAPIGLQGLIWPKAPEILAQAACSHNIPFILSTVSTSSIETIGEITGGRAWFQLYHPSENRLGDDLLLRIKSVGYKVLVLLADVPSFGFRARDIKNGLAMPPKANLKNLLQALSRPAWSFHTLLNGLPRFETLTPYMSKDLNLAQLGHFMNQTFNGVLDEDKVARLRDKWKGKLVIKGLATEEDTRKAIKLGLDGVIVSNHGGRQLDAGESSIDPLQRIAKKYGKKIKVMVDSGIRSGSDIGRAMAVGASFTFLGRSFMYGVAALGARGGNHTIALLKAQLQQQMEQLRCEKITHFPRHYKKN